MIRAGTTYTRNDGREVHIEGPAKSGPIDGQVVFWSRCGDWYAADGRRVSYTREGGAVLLAADNWRSLKIVEVEAAGTREADRVDGYDRDDLGESPDF